MPSLSRRREEDARADRLESEIRSVEQKTACSMVGKGKGLPQCQRCGKTFEEYSRHCPRCDTKTMGWIRPVPEQFREQFRKKEIEKSKRRLGLI